MDRIIFDNVQRGFPANEKFMQMVDKNRLAVLEVCRGVFGDRPTILKGVEPTIISENQGKKQISISSGVVWTGSDLVYIKESQVETVDPDRTLTVIIGDSREKGKFHDGNEYDAYLRNEGRVIATDILPDEMLLRNYSRVNIHRSVDTKIVATNLNPTGYDVKGTLRQTVYSDGRTNICGTIAVLNFVPNEDLYKSGIKVAQLSVFNADVDKNVSSGKTRRGNAYPASVAFELGAGSLDERNVSFAYYVKMTHTGELYIYVPCDKLDSSVITAGIYLDAYISMDFTFNSVKR